MKNLMRKVKNVMPVRVQNGGVFLHYRGSLMAYYTPESGVVLA